MKVALLHYRYGRFGGMDAYLLDLVQGFSQLGDQVEVWAYEQSPDVAVPPGVRVRVIPFHPRPAFTRKIAFYTKLARKLDPSAYDLVIGTMRTAKQDIHINGGTHVGFVRNLTGKFRVTDVIPGFFERRTFLGSRAIVAHSNKVAREIQETYGVPAEKIHVLYPPVDEKRFNREILKKKSDALARYGIDPGKFTVLFPSTNHQIKGLAPLLEAFSMLPANRFQLVIVGASLEADMALPKHVRHLGYVPKLEEIYAATNLVALPSRYDGFGLVITEALACGVPVLASKACGASELIEKRHGIILEDLRPETIAKGIEAARETAFDIEPDFLQSRGLTPRAHVEAIKKINPRRIAKS